MKQLLNCLLLFLCLNVHAQRQGQSVEKGSVGFTVSGQIIGQDNNKPLAGATVTLKSVGDSLISHTVSTNSSGIFSFTGIQKGQYDIVIVYISYSTKYIKSLIFLGTTDLQLGTIGLQRSNHDLHEIVIKAGARPFIEQQIDKTVINVGSLASNSGVTAVEVLNNAPAVEITESALSLRGRSGVSVYINGRQVLLEGQELVNYLRSLPSGTIDKIELMPMAPAKYHSGPGGVINIITKKNNNEGLSGNFNLGYTQAKSANTNDDFSLNYKTGKMNVFFTGSYVNRTLNTDSRQERHYYSTDNVLDQVNSEIDQIRIYRSHFAFDYKGDKQNSIGVNLDVVTSPYHENGSYQLDFSHSSVDSSVRTQSILNRSTRNFGGNINYGHVFNDPSRSLTVTLDYLYYYDNAAQSITSGTYLPQSPNMTGNFQIATENPFHAFLYSARTDYEGIFGGVKIQGGGQLNISDRNSDANYFSKNTFIDTVSSHLLGKEITQAAYITLSKELRRFVMQLGLRYENTSAKNRQIHLDGSQILDVKNNYSNILPSIYLSYKVDTLSNSTLNLNFNSRLDKPGYSSLNPFVFYFDKYSTLQGNPTLLPDKSLNFDLFFSKNGLFSLGTRMSIDNNSIIQYFSTINTTLISTLINVDKFRYYSLYTNYSVALNTGWSLSGYAELFNQIYKGNINGSQFVNNLTSIKFQLNNQIKIADQWTSEVTGYFTSSNTAGQGETLPVWRVNATIQKKLFSNKATLTFSATDLFKSQITRKELDIIAASFNRRASYDSRRFSVSFGYKFGKTYRKANPKSGLDVERKRVGAN